MNDVIMQTRRQKQKKKGFLQGILLGILLLYAAVLCALGAADFICPDVISVYGSGIVSPAGAYCQSETATLTVGGFLPIKTVTVRAYEETMLYPGGMLFGVQCSTDGVLVVGLEDVKTASEDKNQSVAVCPAKEAGLHTSDLITVVDGVKITTVKALTDAITADGIAGRPVNLTVLRGEKSMELSLTPCKDTNGIYRAGIWSRDTTAGIGTVTFIDPKTGLFGGLGHGICDLETGDLLPLTRGTTLGVNLSEIISGTQGKPGELRGSFLPKRTGSLLCNTTCGVFGIFASVPDMIQNSKYENPIPAGHRTDVHAGEATLLCTLMDGVTQEYTIQIISVGDAADTSNKNFVIEVTDPALLEQTGGIVQGMSGSPIIQDGKLIGAVTHVLVNQPQRGYGIFIENMLSAMDMQALTSDMAA